MSDISAMGSMNTGMMQGMHRGQHKPDAGKLTNDFFAKLDPAGQGAIDSQSFLAALSSQLAKPEHGVAGAAPAVTEDDASQFFTAMDGNSDGKVTQEEMTAMFQKVSDQFQTRMQMMQQQASVDSSGQASPMFSGHRGHKPDALNNSDALMQAVNSAQTGTTPTTANANSATDQLQRQLMQMMRRYEQMGATPTSSLTASTASATGASPSVSVTA